jgi:hypothetical protein
MHFAKPLLALLTVLPFIAHADPEQALQFKAVDVARKRQANDGEWVSSHPQCTQVCMSQRRSAVPLRLSHTL